MKRLVAILMICGMICCLVACGNNHSSSGTGNENTTSVSNIDADSQESETELSKNTEQSSGTKNALVAYFAYLQLMAQVIQKSKEADVFHIYDTIDFHPHSAALAGQMHLTAQPVCKAAPLVYSRPSTHGNIIAEIFLFL